ncbi:MAG: hypothetical protein DMD79_17390 [Candidatus Rokuibacteriota bacterium]|nr:MAG: hypothetical protein DMD79_17390 [Candidatus Rokubacteria bacterium]
MTGEPAPGPGTRAIGVITRQGRRAEMQDRYVVAREPEGLFVGVYDGHGGSVTVELTAQHLHLRFFAALREGVDAVAAFSRAFAEVDRLTQEQTCGTGATAFFLAGRRLVAANLGDGRLVLLRGDGVEAVTRDHRVDDPDERARVLAAGAGIDYPYVVRGDAGLMLTRSFGDRWFRPVGVIASPEVFTRTLEPADRWLVAACDGLWDELDNAAVATIVRGAAGAQRAAEALGDAVASLGDRDNLTVIVVDSGAWADPAHPPG